MSHYILWMYTVKFVSYEKITVCVTVTQNIDYRGI